MPQNLPLSRRSMSTVVCELLRLRFHLATQSLLRQPSAQITTAIALFLLLPAAVQIGRHSAMTALHPPLGSSGMNSLITSLLFLHLLHIIALLAGANFGIFGETIPASVLRPLPLRPGTILITDTITRLASLPTFAIGIAYFMMGIAFGAKSILPLLLLLLLAIALSLFFRQAVAAIYRRLQGQSRIAFAVGAVLLAVILPLLNLLPRSAFAAMLSDGKGNPVTVRLRGDPPPSPAKPLPWLLRISPPGLAAQTIRTTSPSGAVVPLLPISVLLGMTIAATIVLDRRAYRSEIGDGATGTRNKLATGASRNAGLFRTEWLLLIRHPAAHLALRSPATLLLTFAFAWIAPNLGTDAARNLTDLLGMGSILYLLIWQMQFLCNRFGSDAGTAATLFTLPMARHQLLIAKNTSLLLLLLVVDGIGVTILTLIARAAHLIPLLLCSLLPLLILATALGNIVSVLIPFPIRRRGEKQEREPDRSLTFVYALIGGGAWMLFLPVIGSIHAFGAISGGLLGAGYCAGLYAASIAITARLLTPQRERRMIAALDGGRV